LCLKRNAFKTGQECFAGAIGGGSALLSISRFQVPTGREGVLSAQQLAVFARLGDGIVDVGAQCLKLGGAGAQIAKLERRPRLLYACFDFNALVFAKAMDPSDVAAAIFPVPVLKGVVVKNRFAGNCAIGVLVAVIPKAFLEKSGQ
jgi:hypothetical protein